jgi:hypothetical protein
MKKTSLEKRLDCLCHNLWNSAPDETVGKFVIVPSVGISVVKSFAVVELV